LHLCRGVLAFDDPCSAQETDELTDLRNALSRLETRLSSIVEGSAARIFPDRRTPQGVTHSLVEAMRNSVRSGADGVPEAANLYILVVHPDQVEPLLSNPAFLDELASLLRQASQEGGLRLSGPLVLRVEPGWDMAPGEVQVRAQNSLSDLSPTTGLSVAPDVNPNAPPQEAFLIVDGVRVFTLEAASINIGRREDNHLIIDDPRVSRLHAQLRLVRGVYVIFDLDSTGGTFVNGQRIRQYSLRAGDVISLAGVPLVFGQEIPEPGDTQEVAAE
jgi:hypothetical protein